MKKKLLFILLFSLILTGCSTSNKSTLTGSTDSTSNTSSSTDSNNNSSDDEFSVKTNDITIDAKFSSFDQTTNYSKKTDITLKDSTCTIDGDGAILEGNDIIISQAGDYYVTGTLNDGQIIVNAAVEDNVHIILDNASIACSDSAPIYVKNCNNAVITLVADSDNTLTDSTSYTYDDAVAQEPNACLFSCDDLSINGTGKLTVNANFYNGISSKDDLKIISGDITIQAVNNGIRGKDSVAIKDGIINITAGKDGIKSNNDADNYKGYLYIAGGDISIKAGSNGLQAITALKVVAGAISITSEKDAINCIGLQDIADGCIN